jgi:hypothetical protein
MSHWVHDAWMRALHCYGHQLAADAGAPAGQEMLVTMVRAGLLHCAPYRASCNDVAHVSMCEAVSHCLEGLSGNLCSLQAKALGAEAHLQHTPAQHSSVQLKDLPAPQAQHCPRRSQHQNSAIKAM